MILTMVPMSRVPRAWPKVAGWIEGACARVASEYEPDDLRGLCERGEAGLVLIGHKGRPARAAGVRQIRDHANGQRTSWVLAVGGARSGPWRAVMRGIETDARAKGCVSIHFVGRLGWSRLLPDFQCQRTGARAEYRKDLL